MDKIKRFSINPFTYIFILWFFVCGRIVELLNFSLALFFHEYAHYFVAKKLGYSLNKFSIAPYGACLNYKEKQFEKNDEIKIAFAGPILNLILVGVCIAFWWIFPTTYAVTYQFVEQNLFLAIFNLFPIYPLDGGRIFVAICSKKLGRKKAIVVVQIINITLSVLFFALFVISLFISFNPTFLLATIFILSGQFQGKSEVKYQNSFLQKKKVSSFSKPRILLAKDELSFNQLLKKIDGDCYTIFEIISSNGEHISLTENQIINYCVNFDGNDKLNILFKL